MPRKNRLTGAEIRGIRTPRRIHGDFFSVVLGPLVARSPKCACVVSKKIAVKAHDRNVVKRRCRAALAKVIEKLPLGSYVFHAKKGAPAATFADIETDIARIARMLSTGKGA